MQLYGVIPTKVIRQMLGRQSSVHLSRAFAAGVLGSSAKAGEVQDESPGSGPQQMRIRMYQMPILILLERLP
jgi:hypothetical protein